MRWRPASYSPMPTSSRSAVAHNFCNETFPRSRVQLRMVQDPKAVGCEFERTYALGRAPAVRELERCVLGCDYGGTSWTTRQEADRMIGRLDLRSGVRLLDLGAGSGWPGLYLARDRGLRVA